MEQPPNPHTPGNTPYGPQERAPSALAGTLGAATSQHRLSSPRSPVLPVSPPLPSPPHPLSPTAPSTAGRGALPPHPAGPRCRRSPQQAGSSPERCPGALSRLSFRRRGLSTPGTWERPASLTEPALRAHCASRRVAPLIRN